MTLSDLVEKARDADPNISTARCTAIVQAAFDGIKAAMARGEEVKIPKFGTFYAARRAPGKVRNMRTGEDMDVPARQVARFKPVKSLKNALNPAPRVGGGRMSPATGDQRAVGWSPKMPSRTGPGVNLPD